MEEKELKLYEFLGIKQFRKLAFKFRDGLFCIINFKKSKEENEWYLRNSVNNYTVDRQKGLKGFYEYRKWIIFNAVIHLISIFLMGPNLIMNIGVLPLPTMIFSLILFIINIYCIILQRYNWIRIKSIIKRGQRRTERCKEELLKKIKELDDGVEKHTYRIEKRKESSLITYESFCKEITLEQLKKYRKDLEYFKEILVYLNERSRQADLEVSIPKNKRKTLDIKFKY